MVCLRIRNLLRRVVVWGLDQGGDQSPIPIDDVFAIIDEADFSALVSPSGTTDPKLGSTSRFNDLLGWIGSVAKVEPDLDAAGDYDVPIQEDKLVDWLWEDPDLPADGLRRELSSASSQRGCGHVRCRSDIKRTGGWLERAACGGSGWRISFSTSV